MTTFNHKQSIFDLKNTLAVLGASIGVAMAPVVVAADALNANVNGDNAKVEADRKAGSNPKSNTGDGSVRPSGELLPAVKPQSAPGAASQLKLDGVKSAPQGAGQYKENSPDQQKTDTGKNGLIGLLTPAGAAQIKIDGKTSPQGAQQLKIEGKTAPQAGQ